jgi:hypothetical protein
MPVINAPITFDMVGRAPYTSLYIDAVQADGTLVQTTLFDGNNDRSIIGSYDSSTGVIRFNDAEFPGLILTTTFYTGNAIPQADGTVQSFVGSWTDQEFTFDESRKMMQVRQRDGHWMAINPHKPIL